MQRVLHWSQSPPVVSTSSQLVRPGVVVFDLLVLTFFRSGFCAFLLSCFDLLLQFGYSTLFRYTSVMGWNDDEYVLGGPRTPYWGCNRCGSAYNYASRIKCRCGAAAATSNVQAAKRNAAAANLHPKVTPKPRGGPQGGDKRDKELAELRAEVKHLRAEGLVLDSPGSDEAMVDVSVGVDIG